MNTAIKTCFITIFYIALGCVFYSSVEKKPCESEDRLSAPDYDEEECVEPWTVIDALYFSMVTMSTVGYGDLTPTSGLSKIFTCLYILVGVTVVFVRIANALGGVLAKIEEYFDAFLMMLSKTSHGQSLRSKTVDLDGDGDADFVVPHSSQVYWARGLTPGCIVLVLIQFVSALMFMYLQADLQFGDAMYHCFVTATTVGYGDISLTTQESRFWAFFHIALSVAWLGAFISRVGELQTARVLELQHYQMLLKQLDEDFISSLDQDGSGVNKLEFVMGMLIKLGAELCGAPLGWSDVTPFLVRFDAMDVDKSGHLSKEDLTIMAEQAKQKNFFAKHGRASSNLTQSNLDDVKHLTRNEKQESIKETLQDRLIPRHLENKEEKMDRMDAKLTSMAEELKTVLKLMQDEMPKKKEVFLPVPSEGMPSSDVQEGLSDGNSTNILNTVDQKKCSVQEGLSDGNSTKTLNTIEKKLNMIVECMISQHLMSQHERPKWTNENQMSQHQTPQGPNGGQQSCHHILEQYEIPPGPNEGMSSLNMGDDSREQASCHPGSWCRVAM